MATTLKFRDDFDPALLNWGAPDQAVSDNCSICDAAIPEDAVPLRMWREDGWALVLCDDCVAKHIVAS